LYLLPISDRHGLSFGARGLTRATAGVKIFAIELMRITPTASRIPITQARWLLLIAVSLTAAGCSTSLYKVVPPSTLKEMPAGSPSVNVGSLTFQASPLLTDEQTQELFESNLQLAGLLPVRMAIRHNGGGAMELKKLRFQLHDASGAEWKLISAKQAISRILKANGVFTYNPNSRKTFEKEFRAYELDLKSPLSNAEGHRQGLIIFLSPKKEPVTSPRNLVLTIQGLTEPASLNLN
jgi:hypothetical protein